MKCPLCEHKVLQSVNLEQGPVALECESCGGRWIRSFHYWKWREHHGKSLPEKPSTEGLETTVSDTAQAKICPECGHILSRYPVGHETAFSLDRCGHCGGMWFDRNEWDVLENRNLHDDVHMIFSTVWQAQVRREDHRKAVEQLRVKMFGDADYAKLQSIREWIRNHPLSHEIRAFLLDDDHPQPGA